MTLWFWTTCSGCWCSFIEKSRWLPVINKHASEAVCVPLRRPRPFIVGCERGSLTEPVVLCVRVFSPSRPPAWEAALSTGSLLEQWAGAASWWGSKQGGGEALLPHYCRLSPQGGSSHQASPHPDSASNPGPMQMPRWYALYPLVQLKYWNFSRNTNWKRKEKQKWRKIKSLGQSKAWSKHSNLSEIWRGLGFA